MTTHIALICTFVLARITLATGKTSRILVTPAMVFVLALSGANATAQADTKSLPACVAAAAAIPKGNSAIIPVPRVGKEETWIPALSGKIASAERRNSQSPIQVIFDGDSITAFFTSRGADIWRTYETKYHAFDFAVSGDSTENVLCRLYAGQARGLHPKLIFLMIGHNNLMNNKPEQIYDGVAAIIKTYERVCPDAMIILQATFPTKEPGSSWRKASEALDKLLPKLADPGKVTYIDFGDKFLSPDGTISKEIMPDGTHPEKKGFEIWAAAIQPIFDQYFPAPKN